MVLALETPTSEISASNGVFHVCKITEKMFSLSSVVVVIATTLY